MDFEDEDLWEIHLHRVPLPVTRCVSGDQGMKCEGSEATYPLVALRAHGERLSRKLSSKIVQTERG